MTTGGGAQPDLKFDHGGVRTQGNLLHQAAEELAGVNKSLGGGHGGGLLDLSGMLDAALAPMQFGEYAGAAFHAFAQAWHTECATLEGALRELKGGLGTSGGDFHHTDHQIKGGLEAIVPAPRGRS